MNSFQELEGCCLPSFSASASLAARSLNNMLYLPWSV
jgi:lambda repressor-like predicted transcriptional regulator